LLWLPRSLQWKRELAKRLKDKEKLIDETKRQENENEDELDA